MDSNEAECEILKPPKESTNGHVQDVNGKLLEFATHLNVEGKSCGAFSKRSQAISGVSSLYLGATNFLRI